MPQAMGGHPGEYQRRPMRDLLGRETTGPSVRQTVTSVQDSVAPFVRRRFGLFGDTINSVIRTGTEMLPGVGDVMAIDDVREAASTGDGLGVGLGLLSALPLIPGLGGAARGAGRGGRGGRRGLFGASGAAPAAPALDGQGAELPKTYYHGSSNRDIVDIDPSLGSGNYGQGFYTTTIPDRARSYAGADGRVYPIKMSGRVLDLTTPEGRRVFEARESWDALRSQYDIIRAPGESIALNPGVARIIDQAIPPPGTRRLPR